jgi:hypothetical protein
MPSPSFSDIWLTMLIASTVLELPLSSGPAKRSVESDNIHVKS